jgi:sodium/proline symporter
MTVIAISFLVYILGIIAFGVYSARFARDTSDDFFLAGRGLGPWVAALSSSASAESGWVTMGLVGMSFNVGLGALWIVPGTVLAFMFNWLILARRLRQASVEHRAITLLDILVSPYSGSASLLIRALGILILVTMLTTYTAAQMTAAAKAIEATFDWNYLSGVAIGAALVLIYTTTGGFRAVAWTDVVQAVMMIAAVLVLPILMILEIGGFDSLWQRLRQLDDPTLLHPVAGNAGLALIGFFGLWLGIPLGNPGQPHVLVRFMAIRDERSIYRGTIISTGWVFFLFTGAVLLGIAARGWYGELPDPEKALPIAAIEFLPAALAGMMIAAVLAAVASTADSQLLLSASAVSHDLVVRLLGKGASEGNRVLLHRVTVLLVGLSAMLIAMSESRAIFHFVLYAWAGLGAAFGPALILTLLWHRTTGWGVLAGMLVGFTSAVAWIEIPVLKELIYEMGPAFALATLAILCVSVLTVPSPRRVEATSQFGPVPSSKE